jgi:Tfp pilus assembly protein PilX
MPPRQLPPLLEQLTALGGQLVKTMATGAAEALLDEAETGLRAVTERVTKARQRVVSRRQARKTGDVVEGEVVDPAPRRRRRR